MKTPNEKFICAVGIALAIILISPMAFAICPYDYNCLDNPYGAGSPYKPDGLKNPYSCVFRTKSSTRSGANRPLIPVSSRPPIPGKSST